MLRQYIVIISKMDAHEYGFQKRQTIQKDTGKDNKEMVERPGAVDKRRHVRKRSVRGEEEEERRRGGEEERRKRKRKRGVKGGGRFVAGWNNNCKARVGRTRTRTRTSRPHITCSWFSGRANGRGS
ncbi:hypothetical protein CI102_4062 [Trichoderma harzianum]|nr:hypothetical protein CI102_4062 [Trichoderma harzianum]